MNSAKRSLLMKKRGMKHRRTHSQPEPGGMRDSDAPPRQDQVIGKEMDETAQRAAEGAMRSSAAIETACASFALQPDI